MSQEPKIIYTHTDEAPALATRSCLPILEAFAAPAGVTVETRDSRGRAVPASVMLKAVDRALDGLGGYPDRDPLVLSGIF